MSVDIKRLTEFCTEDADSLEYSRGVGVDRIGGHIELLCDTGRSTPFLQMLFKASPRLGLGHLAGSGQSKLQYALLVGSKLRRSRVVVVLESGQTAVPFALRIPLTFALPSPIDNGVSGDIPKPRSKLASLPVKIEVWNRPE